MGFIPEEAGRDPPGVRLKQARDNLLWLEEKKASNQNRLPTSSSCTRKCHRVNGHWIALSLAPDLLKQIERLPKGIHLGCFRELPKRIIPDAIVNKGAPDVNQPLGVGHLILLVIVHLFFPFLLFLSKPRLRAPGFLIPNVLRPRAVQE